MGLYHPRSNVYFAAADPEDADAVQRGCGLLSGVAMVLLQCMVVMSVWAGTNSTCDSSDQCDQAGRFCAVGREGRCNFCGRAPPLPPQTDPATGGTLNRPKDGAFGKNMDGFAGFNLTAVAELCADPSLFTGDWDSGLGPGLAQDWMTTSYIVSWCKSGNDALDPFITRPFLAHDKGRLQANPASTPSTARWTR